MNLLIENLENIINAIQNSAHIRYPNGSFIIIEVNRLIWKFLAKGVIKERIYSFLLKGYKIIKTKRTKTVEEVAKIITKAFKSFFFKRF